MWNFSSLKALILWVRIMPMLLVRLVVFVAIAAGLAVAVGAGAWIGNAMGVVGGAVDSIIGGAAGLALAGLVLVFWRGRLLHSVRVGLIALIVDLLDGVRVPIGQGQIAHARAAVAARFGKEADLHALNRLVRSVTSVVPAVAEGVGTSQSMPVLGRLAMGGLVDQAVLGNAYRARPENAWEAAHDGLVLVTQNARDLLGTAARVNAVGWLVTGVVFVFLLSPLSGLSALWPGARPEGGYIAAALSAWAIRSALIQPFAFACLWQAFLRITVGQEPLGEWRGRLTQVSGPFRHLGEQAITWAPDPDPEV